jgi:hypothetical protein
MTDGCWIGLGWLLGAAVGYGWGWISGRRHVTRRRRGLQLDVRAVR